ncbi:RagB/SusD family nutrient uptake outer membrane protein [Chitinophaga sp. CF118]|uniref:RagB/SusD family nutrient uptake outer membrane protein n=1 Tax=Chitinophaga sp. CF118 TaxID=1884367 RepID=UPI0015A5D82A|nr:RagB/SusD family nutrient uptake outer membrane protein [Chitinophaga sp. CF118]
MYIIYCLLLIPVACKKLITVDTPASELPADLVLGNDELADAAVADIYYVLSGRYTSSALFFINGMTADELTTLNTSHMRFVNNAIPVDDILILYTWRDFYKAIYRANAILEGLVSSNISAEKKMQLIGETRFLRAFCYYYLVSNWGDVPLITSTDINQTELAARAPVADIYKQMMSDLEIASLLLSATYRSNEKVRANKWAAIAMLARVYLQWRNWAEAEKNAALVINSGMFPNTQPDSVFFKNSQSAILQFWMKDGYTYAGQTFIPVSDGYSNYPFTTDFMNAFEPGDLRKTKWTSSFTYAGGLYYYPYKYKKNTISTSDDAEYVMVLRIAELYLIRAEARCHQDDISGAVADLNIIRHYAGLTDLPSDLTKENCLLAVEKERKVELFTEWGDRWLTLQRNGRIDTVLKVIKPYWTLTDTLYPVPKQERDRNPNLTQNAGY